MLASGRVGAAYVTPLGPVVPDHSHQAKSGGGFDKSAFASD
ncbi:hypothetical protein [Streptomyces caelestis]|uniref:Uncharacterized protein n=1 Tax=Streptomyces caelestis TaxID=36816 RepID=A0A7W9HA99_9ACTN|nr:hypothetical protein [Streptomyces caelestis]MBB5798547.1 hypothetical protein [Streptomyces caelestis]